MQFGNPVVGRRKLIREDIESDNFDSGIEGWAIYRNGDAEFNNVTIRGNLALSDIWTPALSLYDDFAGAPAWNVTSTFVAFTDSQWEPLYMVAPASGVLRCDTQIRGINNNTGASSLSVDIACIESSGGPYPGTTEWVGPGTQLVSPSTKDAAWIGCQVAGTTSNMGAVGVNYVDGLTPGNWYKFKMYWRISSGSAATVIFPTDASKIIITPVV